MKEIPLTQGQVAFVDDDMFEYLNQFKWCARKNWRVFYARGWINKKCVSMHRVILKLTDPNIKVDHIDCNGCNNQRTNLRICTTAQNCMNKRKDLNCTSPYKGVYIDKYRRISKYKTLIWDDKNQHLLGYFKNEIDAAKAYDKKALEFFGEFARLNFPL
jgi:hypothetical protein